MRSQKKKTRGENQKKKTEGEKQRRNPKETFR